MDLSKVSMTSDLNYMKESHSGTSTFSLSAPPNTRTIFTFNHNLGYKPVYALTFAFNSIWNGVYWSENPFEANVQGSGSRRLPMIESWVTNTQLVVRLIPGTEYTSGSGRIYYKIYHDYGG